MQVNFVREHERFIEYASDEQLTANERLLWYALMHIFNQRAEGNDWPDGFIRINNERLLTYVPVSWDAMAKARNKLKQRGLIDFRNGNRNKVPPEYKMNWFYPDCYPIKTDNMGGNIYINLNKRYTKTKKDDDEDDDDDVLCARARVREAGVPGDDPIPDRTERTDTIRDGFARAFGRTPYPAELERLTVCGWQMGFSAEMVCLAMHKAAAAGANKPAAYTVALLDDWREESVMQPGQVGGYEYEHSSHGSGDPVEDVRAREEARERRRQENLPAAVS